MMDAKRVILILLISAFVLLAFSRCASNQNMNNPMPIQVKEIYFEEQIYKGTDKVSGFDIFIEVVKKPNLILDYAYFKGKKLKLTYQEDRNVYTGHYTKAMKQQDLIMSDDSNKEFQNQLPEIEEKIPFDLKDDECMITYTIKGEKGDFKLNNVPKKKE
ncbi:hypothetical protein [Aquimarina sp. I32.4]|uniref:hypothetical protein n=1 Tax=Aquimarina sp. I32.4 TaxID=2053903 RepID=UPI0011AF3A8E|nr:hypothetical protein [Aquimarina sp. I32.4]